MITVSIVTYKHKIEDLNDLIRIITSSDVVKNLFIIDNSPSDILRNYIKNQKTEYYFTGKNIGYGAGHNIAIKKSILLNVTYHLVINPDIKLQEGSLDHLKEFMDSRPDVANLMPKIFYPDGNIQYLCKLLPTPYDWFGRRFNPLKFLVNKRNRIFELQFTGYNKVMEVPYLSGCFMFLRINALVKTGFFDEKIFMYGEETDLCRRLIAHGYKTIFYPEISVVHEFQKGSHKSWRLTWIGIQSAIYYFNKWGWFFDKERKRVNCDTLEKLGYTYNRKRKKKYMINR